MKLFPRARIGLYISRGSRIIIRQPFSTSIDDGKGLATPENPMRGNLEPDREKDNENEDDYFHLEPDNWLEIDPDSKTIATAVGTLPISPVMDPSWREARERHKGHKPPPDWKKKNRFQKAMATNPYGEMMLPNRLRFHSTWSFLTTCLANMLATPYRECQVTRTCLPRFFLQDFNLLRHPETSVKWWAPLNLTPSQHVSVRVASLAHKEDNAPSYALQPPPAVESLQELSEASVAEGASSVDASQSTPAEESMEDKSEAITSEDDNASSTTIPSDNASTVANGAVKAPGKSVVQSAYVLARRDLISGFHSNKSRWYRDWGRLTLTSMPGKDSVWRKDMDTLILDLMCRQLVHDFLYLSELCETQNREYFLPMDHPQDAALYNQRGCFVWFGDEKSAQASSTSTAEVSEDVSHPLQGVENGPGSFAVLEINEVSRDGTLPLHNLPFLLGSDIVASIREKSALFRTGSLFLVRGYRTRQMQLRLWKLQGYLAEYK